MPEEPYDPVKDNLLGKFFLLVFGLASIGGLVYGVSHSNLSALWANVQVATTVTAPASTLEDGLVGHWTFDGPDMDWSSTTAEVRDVSGNGNHGDATTTLSSRSVINGKNGQALRFDGRYDFFMYDAPLLPSSPANGFAASLWLFPQTANASTGDYVYELGGSGALFLQYNYIDNKMKCRMRDNSSVFFNTTSFVIDDTSWHHYACVYDSARNHFEFYVDGVSVSGVDTNAFTGTFYGSNFNFSVGGRGNYAGHPTVPLSSVSALMDDVRLYDRSLSSDEVMQLYKKGEGTKISTTPTLPANDSLNQGLVGHWTFDGPDVDWSSTTAEIEDVSGNGKHLNARSTMSSQSVTAGIMGQSLRFNGVDQYAVVSSPIKRIEPNGFAIFGWAKPEAVSTNTNVIFGKQYDNIVGVLMVITIVY